MATLPPEVKSSFHLTGNSLLTFPGLPFFLWEAEQLATALDNRALVLPKWILEIASRKRKLQRSESGRQWAGEEGSASISRGLKEAWPRIPSEEEEASVRVSSTSGRELSRIIILRLCNLLPAHISKSKYLCESFQTRGVHLCVVFTNRPPSGKNFQKSTELRELHFSLLGGFFVSFFACFLALFVCVSITGPGFDVSRGSVILSCDLVQPSG